MNSRRALNGQDREGYVSLLAMSFAFGLAVFGGALAVGLRAYLVTTASEARDVRARIALESAAAEVLGQLAAGASPAVASRTHASSTISVSRPIGKFDLGVDAPADYQEPLREIGVDPLAVRSLRTVPGMAEASRILRLSASQEDCLRQGFTLGRAPADRVEPRALADLASTKLLAGDQVDIRVSAAAGGAADVLWIRARLTGNETGWAVHDYRRLRGAVGCDGSTGLRTSRGR